MEGLSSSNGRFRARRVQGALKPHGAIRNVIAVASGKGGVGKSTTAWQLTRALHAMGYQVGILDADIQGPSLPTLLHCPERRITPQARTADPQKPGVLLTPVWEGEIPTLSFGYLIPRADQPVVWRGPMQSSALTQLFFDAEWGSLDFLVVDLPPGTGDILLTLGQKIPVTAALVVTTPSDVALADVIKAHRMFEKFGIFVAGWAENMAYLSCVACGHPNPLWGGYQIEAVAAGLETPVLAKIPMWNESATRSTSHLPLDTPVEPYYHALAAALLARLETRAVDYGSRFPHIAVETSGSEIVPDASPAPSTCYSQQTKDTP